MYTNNEIKRRKRELKMANKIEVTTTKGFFIGDPCYMFDKGWSELIEIYFSQHDSGKKDSHVVPFKGSHVSMVSTAYGDGTYMGSDAYEYSVDAGLIGVTPFELIEEDIEDKHWLGRIIKVNKETSASVSYDEGLITITFSDDNLGDITIQTADDEAYDYYEDEDWLD